MGSARAPEQQSTAAKIHALDCIDSAVAADAAAASIDATERMSAARQKIAEGLIHSGHSKEEANAMAEKIIAGRGDIGKALGELGTLATASAGEKTRKGFRAIDQAMINKIMDRAKDQKLVAAHMVRAGLAKVAGDELVATSGGEFQSGLSRLRAGDMDRDAQLAIGGEKFNIDRDMDGNTLLNNSTQENTSRGQGYDLKVLGFTGETVAMMVAGAAIGDRTVKTITGKGVTERVWGRVRSRFAKNSEPDISGDINDRSPQGSTHHNVENSFSNQGEHSQPPSDDLSSNSTTERSTAQPSQRQQELDLETKAKREAAGRWLDNRMKNLWLQDDKYIDSLDSRSQNHARAKRQYFERAMKHLESHGNLDDLDI